VPREGEGNPDTYERELMEAFSRIAMEIRDAIDGGGYVVTFWSAAAAASKWVESHRAVAFKENPDRVLFALLDDAPVRPALDSVLEWRAAYATMDSLGGTMLKPDLFEQRLNTVQIYGDAERSQMQRIDDLIVRLYWLIYRNTRQNQLS